MYLALKKNKNLLPYLPVTKMWHKYHLRRMLLKYKSVVIKPNNGKQGDSIYFVKDAASGYEITIDNNNYSFRTIQGVQNFLECQFGEREFIIQQEIELSEIDDRRFDFRVIVQRKSVNKPWTITGILARKGEIGYKITNRRRHGTAIPFEEALKHSDIAHGIKENMEKEIKDLALEASKTLGRSFPDQKIFGVDIGVQKQGKMFIFELNRWPLLGGFKSLEDKSQYNKIMAYKGKKAN
ncbi:YheC/YheD family protein [Salipaludibacillus keqinensis]|nr:YheC/YheD family protein [Salipaludibacillus keqinensis]